MTDLADSFCERCGTRYSFAPPAPKQKLKGARVLAHAAKHFVLSDSASVNDAMTLARGDVDRDTMTIMTEAFHKTFNFCMQCRQYTCSNCWNEAAGACISCIPLADEVSGGVADDRATALRPGLQPIPAVEPTAEPLAWPTVDLAQAPLPPAANGRKRRASAGAELVGADEARAEHRVDPTSAPAKAEMPAPPAAAVWEPMSSDAATEAPPPAATADPAALAATAPESPSDAVEQAPTPPDLHAVIADEAMFENVAVDRWWEVPFAALDPAAQPTTEPPVAAESALPAFEAPAGPADEVAAAEPVRDVWEGLTVADSWGKESPDLSLTPEELAIIAAQLEHQPEAIAAASAATEAASSLEVSPEAGEPIAAARPAEQAPAELAATATPEPAADFDLQDEAAALEAWSRSVLARNHWSAVERDTTASASAEIDEALEEQQAFDDEAVPEAAAAFEAGVAPIEAVETPAVVVAVETATAPIEAVETPAVAAAGARPEASEATPHRPSLISRLLKRESPAAEPPAEAAEAAPETEPEPVPQWPRATPWDQRSIRHASPPFAADVTDAILAATRAGRAARDAADARIEEMDESVGAEAESSAPAVIEPAAPEIEMAAAIGDAVEPAPEALTVSAVEPVAAEPETGQSASLLEAGAVVGEPIVAAPELEVVASQEPAVEAAGLVAEIDATELAPVVAPAAELAPIVAPKPGPVAEIESASPAAPILEAAAVPAIESLEAAAPPVQHPEEVAAAESPAAPAEPPAPPAPPATPSARPAWPPIGASWPRPQAAPPTAPWPPAVPAPQPAPWVRTAQPAPVTPAATPAHAVGWTAPEGTAEVWIESSQHVMRPASAVRSCTQCALPLSPSARFCRRCGTAQEVAAATGPQGR